MSPLSKRELSDRRSFLASAMGGGGLAALACLMGGNPSTAGEPHHAPKAKRCIFICLLGAPSQFDLFTPKAALQRRHGERLPDEILRNHRFPGGEVGKKDPPKLMATPYEFARFGDSGIHFSDRLPYLSRHADDIAIIHTMRSSQITHSPAQILLTSGFTRVGRPSIGAWVGYGLGSECQNLPAFVVLWSGVSTYSLSSLWSSGMLPGSYGGVPMHTYTPVPLNHLTPPPSVPPQAQTRSLEAIRDLNALRHDDVGDAEIVARIQAYELAARMQLSAPDAADFSQEPRHVLDAYGLGREPRRAHDFSSHCLFARRLVERGVRFVNLYVSSWDHHDDIYTNLPKRCYDVDQPIAALLADLKQRGLLEDTLVVWAAEFGRTPFAQIRTTAPGRDHHRLAFPIWMAGGGVKQGFELGATDELGWNPITESFEVHDMQATILHLLGLDHQRLTVRHGGRRLRLTDVGGRVIQDVLA